MFGMFLDPEILGTLLKVRLLIDDFFYYVFYHLSASLNSFSIDTAVVLANLP